MGLSAAPSFARRSASSFPSGPAWPGVHQTLILPMGMCEARSLWAQVCIAAAIRAIGSGDSQDGRFCCRFRTEAKLSSTMWTFSARCVVGDRVASSAPRTAAAMITAIGPAIGEFGAVGEESHVTGGGGVKSWSQTGTPLGVATGGLEAGLGRPERRLARRGGLCERLPADGVGERGPAYGSGGRPAAGRLLKILGPPAGRPPGGEPGWELFATMGRLPWLTYRAQLLIAQGAWLFQHIPRLRIGWQEVRMHGRVC